MAKNKKLAGMSIKKATVNNKPQQSDNNKKASPTVLPERNKVELPKEINYALSDFYEDGSDLFLPKQDMRINMLKNLRIFHHTN